MSRRFETQARLQGELLQEYLARCELCHDLPQPNGLPVEENDVTVAKDDSFNENQNTHENFQETPVSPTPPRGRKAKKAESAPSRARKEPSASPATRPRKRATASAHTSGSARTTGSMR
jgi:hypothetical protein